MVKKRESIKLIRDSLVKGNVHPILYSVVDFIHPLLSSVEKYEYYQDNLMAKELIDIYKQREVNLSAGEIKRIQNAADRIQTEIRVVGGRAAVRGGRSKDADFDFVIDANNRTRSKISNSLPGSGNLKEGIRKNQDIFRQIDDPSQPQIIFKPRGQ